jgi:hypothetical protein
MAGGCGPVETGEDAHTADRLRSVIVRYDSAWEAKDTAAVSSGLAADYVYVTSTGGRSARAGTLEFLADTSYSIQSQERTDLDISIIGGVARAASRWRGLGRYRGEPVDDDQTCRLRAVLHPAHAEDRRAASSEPRSSGFTRSPPRTMPPDPQCSAA